jgi:hypothetical protein
MRTLKLRILATLLAVFLTASLSDASLLQARDWKKIGGAAAAGAVIGGMTKGKSGAVLGAIAGGAGGDVWDRATEYRYPGDRRSTRESVEIIGASTVAGAATGGMVGGKTGAVIGAAAGAAGGYIYDRKTNNRDRGYFGRRF